MPKILKTHKKNDEKYSKTTVYCISAIKGLMIFLNGLGILSLLVLKNSSDSVVFYVLSFVIMALGGFFSGFSAYRNLRGRGFINGIIASAIYMGIIFIFTIALMRFNISANILIIAPICLISGFLGGTVGANT